MCGVHVLAVGPAEGEAGGEGDRGGPVEGDASAVERLRGSEVVIDVAALAIAQGPSNNHTWQTCKRCLTMFRMECTIYLFNQLLDQQRILQIFQ